MTDIVITQVPQLTRWGRLVAPAWVYSEEISAPPAGTALVNVLVPIGKRGYIYGVYIFADEANSFKINWVSNGVSKSIRIPFLARGAVLAVFNTPINEGYPADGGTSITITNLTAGNTGMIYQAGLLVAVE